MLIVANSPPIVMRMTSPDTSKPKRAPFNTSRGSEFGTLARVFDDVWWAWGTTRFMPGATFPRNMTILREGDGLVIVHPVMMPEAEQAKVEALGPIKHIVRLGDFHGMDNVLYVEKYGCEVWSPRGATPVRNERVDHELVPGGETPFHDGTLHQFDVAIAPEMVLQLRRHDGILLTCDSVQNWEKKPAGCSFLGGLMSKAMGFGGRACIGPGWRKQCEPKTGENFGPKFRELLGLEFRHILTAHGPPIRDTAIAGADEGWGATRRWGCRGGRSRAWYQAVGWHRPGRHSGGTRRPWSGRR